MIGYRDDGFCSIVAEKGQQADDHDLTFAQRFCSLAYAQAAADEEIVNVFEVMKEGDGQETLREIMVDVELAENKPFESCWRVTDRFWAGPTFLAATPTETDTRIKSLAAAGVNSIVSIVNPDDIFLIQQLSDLVRNSGAFPDRFEHSFFAVPDGEAPSRQQMKIILDVIDGAFLQRKTTYLHCQGGRGRTGTVVGCWLARHGYASGQGALDDVMELRCASGVFGVAPETKSQCQLVRSWTKDERSGY